MPKSVGLQTSLKKDFGTDICLLILRNFSEDLFLKNSPKQLLLNTFHFFFRIITRKWRNQKITRLITNVSSIEDFLA